jgi:hypothetical protein
MTKSILLIMKTTLGYGIIVPWSDLAKSSLRIKDYAKDKDGNYYIEDYLEYVYFYNNIHGFDVFPCAEYEVKDKFPSKYVQKENYLYILRTAGNLQSEPYKQFSTNYTSFNSQGHQVPGFPVSFTTVSNAKTYFDSFKDMFKELTIIGEPNLYLITDERMLKILQ